jgi:Domain of unknown function (DUF4424)
LAASLVALLPGISRANTGAAEIGAGGIQLRNERRVSMRKETLHVGLDRIAVDYEFVNESSEKVATEIAFPVPDYWYDLANDRYMDFDDFRLWVAGHRVRVPLGGRAILRGASGERDATSIVREAGLSVERLGGVSDFVEVSAGGAVKSLHSASPIARLLEGKKRELERQGVLASEGEFMVPNWIVRAAYHWRQVFPPRKTVSVRIEYSPARGSEAIAGAKELGEACVSPALRRSMEGRKWAAAWVSYVLTTANTWKMPIGEFELVVERPEKSIVSFCWEGKIEENEGEHVRSVVKDFVPKRELKVFFFLPE